MMNIDFEKFYNVVEIPKYEKQIAWFFPENFCKILNCMGFDVYFSDIYTGEKFNAGYAGCANALIKLIKFRYLLKTGRHLSDVELRELECCDISIEFDDISVDFGKNAVEIPAEIFFD